MEALIGYSGFVGSHIFKQAPFSHVFNSKNIEDIRGRCFDLVVCCGISAVKWWTNKNPEQDRAQIDTLLSAIQEIETKRFILISTVDVYPTPFGVDEDSEISPINHPYGTNRYFAEQRIRSLFPECYHIVRLPGLFGSGLKKNVIYDLLYNNNVNTINPLSSFQYYNLEHIWRDIRITIDHNIPVMNLTTEPIATHDIAKKYFQTLVLTPQQGSPSIHYDVRSKYVSLWDSKNYQYSYEDVLGELGEFIGRQLPPCIRTKSI